MIDEAFLGQHGRLGAGPSRYVGPGFTTCEPSEVKMAEFAEDTAAASIESRWWRRLGRSFIAVDSYGLVLLLVIATYTVSVTVTEAWAASIVLTILLATVWLILRTSRGAPRRSARRLHRAVPGRPRRGRELLRAGTVRGGRDIGGLLPAVPDRAVLHRPPPDAAAKDRHRDAARGRCRLPADWHVLRLRLQGGG